MRDAIAVRRLRKVCDHSLDRDDALGKAAILPDGRKILDADAISPVAEQVKGEQCRHQDQNGAAGDRIGPEPFCQAPQ
ncbi:hypothetical protein [Bosea sp. TAF32]|uniref:hypothetical protein n=1 Tax=Bosea sp. TAF32 TaxID=3237482 RepID=UPI003F91E3B5